MEARGVSDSLVMVEYKQEAVEGTVVSDNLVKLVVSVLELKIAS